jgi:hypothetical protein
MKFCVLCIFALLVEIGSISSFQSSTQTKRDPRSAPPSAPSVDYPEDVGILIRNSDWTEIPNVLPSKTKTEHSVVHSLTYGAVPASVVATYDGAHSEVQIQPGRPIFIFDPLNDSETRPSVIISSAFIAWPVRLWIYSSSSGGS